MRFSEAQLEEWQRRGVKVATHPLERPKDQNRIKPSIPAPPLPTASFDVIDELAFTANRDEFRRIAMRLLPNRTFKGGFQPEQQVQAEIVARADAGLRYEDWDLAVIRIANEARESRHVTLGGALGRALGMMPGAPDLLCVWWPARFGFLEVKRPGGQRGLGLEGKRHTPQPGQLTGQQPLFRDWCIAGGIPWAMVRGVKGAERAWRQWRWG